MDVHLRSIIDLTAVYSKFLVVRFDIDVVLLLFVVGIFDYFTVCSSHYTDISTHLLQHNSHY